MVGNRTGNVDHLVYACADLETGISEVEAILGIRPVFGGRHETFGTHNALLSLGSEAYLEVIARDPELPEPADGVGFNLAANQESRLLTWAIRAENIELVASEARSANIPIGAVQSGSRRTPDGGLLSWQLTDSRAMPMDGAIPFLISWGDTPHPAGAVSSGGELVSLRIEHPDADRVGERLAVLGVKIDVSRADAYRMIATIDTNDGRRELK